MENTDGDRQHTNKMNPHLLRFLEPYGSSAALGATTYIAPSTNAAIAATPNVNLGLSSNPGITYRSQLTLPQRSSEAGALHSLREARRFPTRSGGGSAVR